MGLAWAMPLRSRAAEEKATSPGGGPKLRSSAA